MPTTMQMWLVKLNAEEKQMTRESNSAADDLHYEVDCYIYGFKFGQKTNENWEVNKLCLDGGRSRVMLPLFFM